MRSGGGGSGGGVVGGGGRLRSGGGGSSAPADPSGAKERAATREPRQPGLVIPERPRRVRPHAAASARDSEPSGRACIVTRPRLQPHRIRHTSSAAKSAVLDAAARLVDEAAAEARESGRA